MCVEAIRQCTWHLRLWLSTGINLFSPLVTGSPIPASVCSLCPCLSQALLAPESHASSLLPSTMANSPRTMSRVASRCHAADRINGCSLLRLWNRVNGVQYIGASPLVHRRYIVALSRHNCHHADVGHSVEERIRHARLSITYHKNHCQITGLDLP